MLFPWVYGVALIFTFKEIHTRLFFVAEISMDLLLKVL